MPYVDYRKPERTSLPISRPRWPRRLGIGIFIVIVAVLGFVGYEYTKLTHAILIPHKGQQSAALSLKTTPSTDWSQFQNPGDGRYNLLLLGIGGVADNGQVHDGADLTDSIQVLSFDTINKTVSLTSVPRDFLVTIPGAGPNKINAEFEYGETGSKGVAGGGAAAEAAIGKLLGIKFANFAVIDFTAAQDIVNDIGGIDVDVPTAIYDPSYPCADQIHYCPFSISAGEQHLNGTVALEYMRTRHDDSDFARSGRQQLVVAAIKQKALSVGVLTNPVKLVNILTALGSHVKTDLSTNDIESLVTQFRNIPSTSITSHVLDTDPTEGLLVAATNPYAGDVEEPVGGLTVYGPIQNWFATNNPDPLIPKEAAVITVDGPTTAATNLVTTLTTYGFNATLTPAGTSTDATTSTKTVIRARSLTKQPVTLNYLKSLTGGTVIQDTTLPAGVDIMIDAVTSRSVSQTTTTTSQATSSTGSTLLTNPTLQGSATSTN